MGEPGIADVVFARAPRARRAVRHLFFGRTGYCPRALTAALRRADLVSALGRPARHPCYGRTGNCLRAPPSNLRRADLVFARHACYGKTGYLLRAPAAALRGADLVFTRARHATSLLWANRALPARAACRPETGGSGFGGSAPRAARHPCYGQTGYCLRALSAALGQADLVFARARLVTSLLWANRVQLARAASRLDAGGSCFCARHPCYGQTGYCLRAPRAALEQADLVFALRATSLL